MKRGRALGLLLILMVWIFSMQAFAAGSIDQNQDVNLTIFYQSESTYLSGASFRLFRVADVDESGELMVTKEFQDYFVMIRGEADEAWKSQAATLEGYVLRDQLSPFASGKTDSSGRLTFSTKEHQLTPGLYLVVGERHRQGRWRYDAAPYFVMLPGLNRETNEWTYSVETTVKYEASRIPEHDDEPDTIDRKVLKVWKDEGYENERPSRIVVKLLKNGAVYDTVSLSSENNWSYKWYDLDAEERWSVVEEEVKGYTVSVNRSGLTFVVTNTYQPKEPEVPTKPTTDQPNKPDHSSENASSGSGTSGSEKLPQTGQLWWPVPILVCAGLLCLAIGLVRERMEE